jgi:hypothetical protein
MRWRMTIEEYSRLDLSFGKDKLVTLSSIAKQVQEYRPDG